MWVPLAILAILSAVGGFLFNVPQYLEPIFPLHEEAKPEAWLMYVSVAAGLGGIALAALFYLINRGSAAGFAKNPLHTLIYNKYFVDEFYDSAVVRPTVDGSRGLLWRVADMRFIDGIVNGAGTAARGVGELVRRAQSGYIRNYAAWVVGGTVLVIAYVLRGVAR